MVNTELLSSLAEICQGRLFMYYSVFLFLSKKLKNSDIPDELENSLKTFDDQLYNCLSTLSADHVNILSLTEFDKDLIPSQTPIIISNINEYFYFENHTPYYPEKPDHIVNYLYYMVSKIYNVIDFLKNNDNTKITNNLKYQLRFLNVHFLPFLSKESNSEQINNFLKKLKELIAEDYLLIKDQYLTLFNNKI